MLKIETINESIERTAEALIGEAYRDETVSDPEAVEEYIGSFRSRISTLFYLLDKEGKNDNR